jgi:uncharacterized protein with ACT and thioredoxin-like domain
VALPVVSGTHRLVHLHRNVPGVLASINRVLAEHGVNVEGQMLRTRDELGYVITDIGTSYSEEVLDELRAMDVTIRLRTIESPRDLRLQRRDVGGGDAAVDQERGRGDERGVVAGEERHRGGDLRFLGEPAYRHVR